MLVRQRQPHLHCDYVLGRLTQIHACLAHALQVHLLDTITWGACTATQSKRKHNLSCFAVYMIYELTLRVFRSVAISLLFRLLRCSAWLRCRRWQLKQNLSPLSQHLHPIHQHILETRLMRSMSRWCST